MRMLVLGGGLQGSACAYDLLQNPEVERVILADVRTGALAPFLEPFRGDARFHRVPADARDAAAVRELLSHSDACLNALPYYFNLEIAKLAVEAGVHCCDLGGNTEIVFRQLELDESAKQAGVSIVPDCGLAPGMVNILAQAGIEQVGNAESVRMLVGGLPQHPMPPLKYQVVYSLEGVLDYYTTPSWVIRNSKRAQVEALTEVEAVEFPEPVGRLEAFHTAGGLSTMAWTYEGRIRSMEYKTLRYPGHAEIMRAIRGLGLLENQPVRVDGVEVVPRHFFIACAEPRLHRPESRDLVALRVEVSGQSDVRRTVSFDLIDFHDESTGISAMARTTGFSLSITGQLQASRQVREPGVRTPDQAIPADRYLFGLARRGIEVRRSTKTT